MATLYVENVPADLYKALRKRARENRRSMAAELISLLERNFPTADQLRRRRDAYNQLAALRNDSRMMASSGQTAWQTAEEMVREDRER